MEDKYICQANNRDLLQEEKLSFYCSVLHGDVKYEASVVIDSDMDVHCAPTGNKTGVLGNLKDKTLKEIWNDQEANRYRRELLDGKLPIPFCGVCKGLKKADPSKSEEYLSKYECKHQRIHISNTSLCNYRCISCGGNFDSKLMRQKFLTLDNMEVISKALRDNNINDVAYFYDGDPFMSKNILEELQIIRKHNPNIYIWASTNGVLMDTEEKMEAALMMNYITFSIDGCDQESIEKFQIRGDFKKATENLAKLVQLRNSRGMKDSVILEWKYVVFSTNDSDECVIKAIDIAKSIGVHWIAFYPGVMFEDHTMHLVSKRYYTDPFFINLGNNEAACQRVVFQ